MLKEANASVSSTINETSKDNVFLIVDSTKSTLKSPTDANVLTDTKDKTKSVCLNVGLTNFGKMKIVFV